MCASRTILEGTGGFLGPIGSGETMAHILEFRSNAVRAELECEAVYQDGAQCQDSAQIIIFPGVRIERHAEAPAESQARQRRRERGRPTRDRLELPD